MTGTRTRTKAKASRVKRVKSRTSPRTGTVLQTAQEGMEQQTERYGGNEGEDERQQDDDEAAAVVSRATSRVEAVEDDDGVGTRLGHHNDEVRSRAILVAGTGERTVVSEEETLPTDAAAMATAINDLRTTVASMQAASVMDDDGGERHERRRSRSASRRSTPSRADRSRRRHGENDESSDDDADHRRHSQARRSRGRGSGRPHRDYGGGDSSEDESPDDSPSSDSSSSSESSGDDSSSDEDSGSPSSSDTESERSRRRHGRRSGREHREPWTKRKSVKDLELPTFTPSPKVSVSTWIDRVDLALRGAKESGRGDWSDRALYFIMGNKLMENAARWWVNMDRRLQDHKRKWTYLKKALLRRYGERLDKSAAEWRVNGRRMAPGETYADYAAVLRELVGKNKVSERVLLAQFYRCLDRTMKKLVTQRPKPRTLEKAVAKATKIDDPMDNVAQGMSNIGQAWATAPNPYLIPMTGTTGQTVVIPGIGGSGLLSGLTSMVSGTETSSGGSSSMALFTNPQGVWNPYSGTWDVPLGHTWNGKYWAATSAGRKRTQQKDGPPAEKGSKRRLREQDSSGEESDAKPARKKTKAAVKQSTGPMSSPPGGNESKGRPGFSCFNCGQSGHRVAECPRGPRCYACREYGHFARDCSDAEAKARNEEYMKRRPETTKPAETSVGRSEGTTASGTTNGSPTIDTGQE